MKKVLVLCTIAMMFLAFTANAGNGPKNNDPKVAAKIVEAEFDGGKVALADYMKTNLEYPKCAREKALQGKVTISFFVLADGTVHGARVVKGFDSPCNEAALQTVQKMPNWKPATQNGQAAASRNEITIDFSLDI
jgi:TonB family protein